MRPSLFINSLLAVLLIACHPIAVRVGKTSQGAADEQPILSHTPADIGDYSTWNSIEDFLEHLDSIKKLGNDALLQRYHADGRVQIRNAFRQFRDSVAAEVDQDPSDVSVYMQDLDLGQCMPIATTDIFELGAYGDLRSLLEAVFLSKIKPAEVAPVDPATPPVMDEMSKLGFFELGIAMDGQSYFESDGATEIQGSDLRWKVIHEQNEAESWIESDSNGVKFRFLKTHEAPDRNNFLMEARVGPQVYEEDDAGNLPTLSIDYQRMISGEGQSYQALVIQTGLRDRDGNWQSLILSRKISISQDIAQGRILHILARDHWGQPGETQRKFRLDMDQQNLCSLLGTEGLR